MNIKLELAGTKRLASGHPWVRREDLSRSAPPPEAGELVRLQDSMGNFLGHPVSEGPRSASLTGLSRSRHPEFNAAYFASVVEQALARRGPMPIKAKQGMQRLIHGEADALPGVFCDQAGDTLLLEYKSPGLLAFAKSIEEALISQAKPKTMWKRAFGPWENVLGKAQGLKLSTERQGLRYMLRLDLDEPSDFELEASSDMERLKILGVKGEALSVFSGRGSWPAALAAAGAQKVLCLDRDAESNARAAESLGMNAFPQGTFEFEAGDAFAKLDKLKGKRSFQAICVDSPQESKSPHGRFNAAKQLPHLAERALSLAEPGGLAIFSLRRGLISVPTFLGAIKQGAAAAGVALETAATHKAPADFPDLDGFDEAQARLWQAFSVKAL